ncbi:hypothetical protein K9L27_02525 [Candidatus Gracilibacteria bacterium]|nr:hypothetical protein [Candidatus Gracilibacteria bacterium]
MVEKLELSDLGYFLGGSVDSDGYLEIPCYSNKMVSLIIGSFPEEDLPSPDFIKRQEACGYPVLFKKSMLLKVQNILEEQSIKL